MYQTNSFGKAVVYVTLFATAVSLASCNLPFKTDTPASILEENPDFPQTPQELLEYMAPTPIPAEEIVGEAPLLSGDTAKDSWFFQGGDGTNAYSVSSGQGVIDGVIVNLETIPSCSPVHQFRKPYEINRNGTDMMCTKVGPKGCGNMFDSIYRGLRMEPVPAVYSEVRKQNGLPNNTVYEGQELCVAERFWEVWRDQ